MIIGVIHRSTFEFHHQNCLNSMNHQTCHQPSLFHHNLLNQSLFQVFFSWPSEWLSFRIIRSLPFLRQNFGFSFRSGLNEPHWFHFRCLKFSFFSVIYQILIPLITETLFHQTNLSGLLSHKIHKLKNISLIQNLMVEWTSMHFWSLIKTTGITLYWVWCIFYNFFTNCREFLSNDIWRVLPLP